MPSYVPVVYSTTFHEFAVNSHDRHAEASLRDFVDDVAQLLPRFEISQIVVFHTNLVTKLLVEIIGGYACDLFLRPAWSSATTKANLCAAIVVDRYHDSGLCCFHVPHS